MPEYHKSSAKVPFGKVPPPELVQADPAFDPPRDPRRDKAVKETRDLFGSVSVADASVSHKYRNPRKSTKCFPSTVFKRCADLQSSSRICSLLEEQSS